MRTQSVHKVIQVLQVKSIGRCNNVQPATSEKREREFMCLLFFYFIMDQFHYRSGNKRS